MVNILSNGYRVLNSIAPGGVAVAGNPGSGTISQNNNNQAETVSAGDASSDGSIKKVIATDSSDTVNLGSGWTESGTATDQVTGITGTLYTSPSGDQLLISGGAKVNQAPPPAPAPAPAPSSSTTSTSVPTPAPVSPSRPTPVVQKPVNQTNYVQRPTLGNLAAMLNRLYPIGYLSSGYFPVSASTSWLPAHKIISKFNYANMNANYFSPEY